ncbi:MAG: c-type cytochrome [Deltaproteobacteria bacterium]|nr:c-type cytochrome [Deltaproteobacteria bacterium]
MKKMLIVVALASVVGLLIACQTQTAPVETPAAPAETVTVDRAVLAAFQPLPAVFESETNPITEEKIKLGRMLYYDTRLSKAQTISCNTCHQLDKFGVDGKPVSTGHEGKTGTRNAPTVYNAAGHLAQFWDGREPDVEAQAKGPVLNPVEMAMPDEKYVLKVLNSMPEYVAAFKAAFPDDAEPLNYDNFGKAVGAFERKLVTPSRWDTYLKGDDAALTNDEKKGLLAFVQNGCTACHAGSLAGGAMYQKLGLVKPWPDESDLGRYQATKNDADKMYFKVPSLRNIAETGPYYHDGKVATLDDAVRMMADHQLGRALDDEDLRLINAWLGALTGDVPADYVAPPELPPSTDKTPPPSV